MGLENLARCDICKDTAAIDDSPDWLKVMVVPVVPVTPLPQHVPPNLPLVGQFAVAPPPKETMVCHKPSCLTRWAKEENERRVVEKKERAATAKAVEAQLAAQAAIPPGPIPDGLPRGIEP